MVTEMITVKLDDGFLKDIDSVVQKERYQNRTEFIRNALREKVEEARLREAMRDIAHLKGAAKERTSSKEFEEIRKRAFEELSGKLK